MAKQGGARPGAGRKPGAINKATAKAREAAEAGGMMPLDFMLSVMRDDTAERSERLDMAKAAAPYLHAKLTSIEATVDADVTWLPSVVEFVAPDASAD
jgi:hypothetical protein